ncbi:MAG: sugar phosphate nucleotidyltransferase [Parcubacteria group bacterium]
MNIVILAGGSGTRFWPLSRQTKPKQFTSIIGKRSMLECTYERFVNDYPANKIFISTTQAFKNTINKLLPQVSADNIIVEPEKRDTAAAMGYVAAHLSLQDPEEPMAFIPSDHYIFDVKKFIKLLQKAEQVIKKEGKMMDIAVVPNFPSAALGYTQIGDLHEKKNGVEIYKFLGHVEKPSFAKAKEYIQAGNYLWHANFFMWTPRAFLDAYQRYAPHIYQHLEKIITALERDDDYLVDSEYCKMQKISIDYAILEKMNKNDVLIIKGDFGWSDIGTWDVLHDQLTAEADEDDNVIRGEWVGDDTTKCLIYGREDKVIATIGIDDMVVVDTEDALLICPQGRSQDVKKLVEKLKKDKKEKYL